MTVHAGGTRGPQIVARLQQLTDGRVVAVDDPVRAAISLAVRSADLTRSPLHEVDAVLDAALPRPGYLPAVGSRPDSPGVHREIPRRSEGVPGSVWVKTQLAAQHAGDSDDDDCTRAKTSYLDEVEVRFETGARDR